MPTDVVPATPTVRAVVKSARSTSVPVRVVAVVGVVVTVPVLDTEVVAVDMLTGLTVTLKLLSTSVIALMHPSHCTVPILAVVVVDVVGVVVDGGVGAQTMVVPVQDAE